MWYTARILVRVRKIHPTLSGEGQGWNHPLITEKQVARFESLLETELSRRWDYAGKLTHIMSLCAQFPSYLQAIGLKHIDELKPHHILDFLDYLRQDSVQNLSRRDLRAIAKALSVFLNENDKDWVKFKYIDKELRWLGAWYEEMFVLFEAEDEEHATQQAQAWARELVAKYQQNANPTAQWEFVDVLDVYEVLDTEIGSGTEIYSRYLSEGMIPPRYRKMPQRTER